MLLSVNNLNVFFRKKRTQTQLLHNVSFDLKKNQCLGLLGESGSGKSITCAAINGLLGDEFQVTGTVSFSGTNLLELNTEEKRKIRGSRITMVLQSPMTAFNPLFTIASHITETICGHLKLSKKDALDMMADAFARVNLHSARSIFPKYPHELSGGMLQRIMISLAIVLNPDIIIADEPTTAIDYISQQDVIKELMSIREKCESSLIFVSHNLSLMSHIADDLIVLNDGKIVEQGKTATVFQNPTNKHTRYLIETRKRILKQFNRYLKTAHAN